MPAASARLRVMGCDTHLIVRPGHSELFRAAARRLNSLENCWSRFLPDSEISRLNAHAGETVPVGTDTIQLLQLAKDAWLETGGRFDPTVLPALVAAGFGPSRDGAMAPAVPRTARVGGMAATRVDPLTGLAALAPASAFDPGGLAKGLAADIVVSELLASGAYGALVNIGGDLRCAGVPPTPDGWVVSVEHPKRPGEEVARLLLPSGGAGVATTSPRGRFVEPPDHDEPSRHHLIDPATGEPSTSNVCQVTVVARTAARAEVLAKAAYLCGDVTAASDYLQRNGTGGVVVGRDGAVLVTTQQQRRLV